MTEKIMLTAQQKQAVSKINSWYNDSQNQTFFLSGFAGTGKTTIVRPILEKLGLSPRHTRIACYTGKASMVLQEKINKNIKSNRERLKITTIHSLIYNPEIPNINTANLLDASLILETKEEEKERLEVLKKDIERQKKNNVNFYRKPNDRLKNIDLIIIDEASMIDLKIYKDLVHYGIKILFLGDVGQLPPVTKNKERLRRFDNPDFQLTEILRQKNPDGSKDSVHPIIELSDFVRKGGVPRPGVYGSKGQVKVISRHEFYRNHNLKNQAYLRADQIICKYNKTRKQINTDVRRLKNIESKFPTIGDKLICLRNNPSIKIDDIPLVNGLIGYVTDIYGYDDGQIDLELAMGPDEINAEILSVSTSTFSDQEKHISMYDSPLDFFDYGYAVTCHKSQGSQWKNVLVIYEPSRFNDYEKWLYTAVTRAEENLILVI